MYIISCIFFFYLQTQGPICPHCIVALPNSNGMQLLLCYDNEGVYVNTYGRVSKTMVLQWGEMPTSVAYIGTGQIMGWGNKAIEIRSVESGHLDGVFMHKKAQRLKFLCERNDKVRIYISRQRVFLRSIKILDKKYLIGLYRFIVYMKLLYNVISFFRCSSHRRKAVVRARFIS